MKLIISLFFLISCSTGNLYLPDTYKVKSGDTLTTIAKERLDSRHPEEEDYNKIALRKFNPQITNWDQLEKGTILYLDRPLTPYLMNYPLR